MGDILGDFIGLPDVTGQYGYGIAPHTVHADHGWVGVLIFYMGAAYVASRALHSSTSYLGFSSME